MSDAESLPAYPLVPARARVTRADALAMEFEPDDENPAWRWDLARRLSVERFLPVSLRDRDFALWDAVQYLKAADAASSSEFRLRRVAANWPHIATAERIHRGGGFKRWTIEAFVMSGEPAESLAAALRLRSTDVLAYEALFFDMRRLREWPLLIDACFFGPVHRGCTPQDPDMFWKLVGWLGGPRMLSSFVRIAASFSPEETASLQNLLRGKTLRNALAAAFSTEPTRWNSTDIQRLHVEFETAHRAAAIAGQDTVQTYTTGVLSAIASIIGTRLTLDSEKKPVALPEPTEMERLEQCMRAYVENTGPAEVDPCSRSF